MKSSHNSHLKKALCMVMAVLLTFGVFFNAAFVANAAEERNSNFGGAPVASGSNWKYYSDGELVITGNIANCSEEAPAEWNKYAANINTVTIQTSVTSIGDYAFYGFTRLKTLYVPGSVTSISTDAFKGCSSLTKIYSPKSYDEVHDLFPEVAISIEVNHSHDNLPDSNITLKHTKAATCKEEGYSGDVYCSLCGAFVKTGKKTETTQNHNWSSDYKEVIAATCQKEGLEAKYCTICGAFSETDTRTTSKTAHKMEWDGKKIANCEAGTLLNKKCAYCDHTETFTVSKNHTYLYKTTQPTCTKEGKIVTTCKYCNKINETKVLPPVGHNKDEVERETPTCAKPGYINYKCSYCHAIQEYKTLPKLEHKFDIEVTDDPENGCKKPTCPTAGDPGIGYKAKKCSLCGEFEKNDSGNVILTTIPNLHSEDTMDATPVVLISSTCQSDGAYGYICNICNEKIYKNDEAGKPTSELYTTVIPQTPDEHNASKWITIDEPSCDKSGVMIKKCTTRGCPFHSDGEIGAAIDKASNTTVVNAIATHVDDDLATKIADYVREQRYKHLDISEEKIAEIILENANSKINYSEPPFVKEGASEEEIAETKKLAEDIINSAAAALTASISEDPFFVVTKQKVVEYLLDAFDEMGDNWVAEAVAGATDEEKDSVKKITLNSQEIPATGHKYQTVSYYKEHIAGEDVYTAVALGSDGNYYVVSDYEKDDEGNIIYDEVTGLATPVVDDSDPDAAVDTDLHEIVSEVDCNEGGTLVKQCPVCLSLSSTVVAKGKHKFNYPVVEPTCTAQGYTIEECEFCTYKRTFNYTPATGHSWKTVTLQESTCTQTGLQAEQCEYCKEIKSDSYSPIPVVKHDFETTVIKPGCETEGYTLKTCKVCGAKFKEDFTNSLGHDYNAVVTDPTCETDGYTTHTCSLCGNSYTDTPVPAKNHKWSEAKEIPASCTTDAYTQRICSVCGKEEKTNIQPDTKLTHIFIDDPAVAATCTKDGKTAGQHCDLCGYVNKAQETIPAKGHSPVNVAAKAATCTEPGNTAGKKCSVCNDILEGVKTIPAKGHTPDRTKATCTEDKTCTVCHTVLEKASGHSYGEWITTKEYTAFRNGEEAHTCSKCGAVETRAIVPNIIQRIAWIFTHFLDIILALLGRANNIF